MRGKSRRHPSLTMPSSLELLNQIVKGRCPGPRSTSSASRSRRPSSSGDRRPTCTPNAPLLCEGLCGSAANASALRPRGDRLAISVARPTRVPSPHHGRSSGDPPPIVDLDEADPVREPRVDRPVEDHPAEAERDAEAELLEDPVEEAVLLEAVAALAAHADPIEEGGEIKRQLAPEPRADAGEGRRRHVATVDRPKEASDVCASARPRASR